MTTEATVAKRPILTVDGVLFAVLSPENPDLTLEAMKGGARLYADAGHDVSLRYADEEEIQAKSAAVECLWIARGVSEELRDRAIAASAKVFRAWGQRAPHLAQLEVAWRQQYQDICGRFVADEQGRLTYAG